MKGDWRIRLHHVCVHITFAFFYWTKTGKTLMEFLYQRNIWIMKLVVLSYVTILQEFIYLYSPQSLIPILYVLQNKSISKTHGKSRPWKGLSCEIFNIFEQTEKWQFLFISTYKVFMLLAKLSLPNGELFAVLFHIFSVVDR